MSDVAVLVVDDSATVRCKVADNLKACGVSVVQAGDGLEALNVIRQNRVDLVVTDVRMPKMDGFALCRRLKMDDATRDIPVVILSSHAADEDVQAGFEAGAAAYLPKAEMGASFIETVQRVLDRSSLNHSRKVLIVEDSRSIREHVITGLARAGFYAVGTANGRQALDAVGAGLKPDLIVSDIEMPEMDGIAFLSAYRQIDQAVPFVVMSSFRGRASVRRMMQLGADGYIVKPFDLEQLIVTVEFYLSSHYNLLQKEKDLARAEKAMLLASIASISAALEARDSYTQGHSEGVAMLLAGAAHLMNFSSEEKDLLAMAGKLHDIGKIGVPDSVLLKPGRLSAEEFECIKRHTVTGAGILKEIPMLEAIIPVILHHHERFDGAGYPCGLKGEGIPLWARMAAVADTYDALCSDRPYRKGLPRHAALQIIRDVRGSQLCPECVDMFLRMLD